MDNERKILCYRCVEMFGDCYDLRPVTAHTSGKCSHCGRRGLVAQVVIKKKRGDGNGA